MIDVDLLNDINEQIHSLKPDDILRIPNLDESVYHATDAIGSSSLKNFIKAPAIFKAGHDGLLTFDSQATRLGSAVHGLVLEPDVFHDKFVEIPNFDRRTKKGKEDYAKWYAQNNGKIQLKKTDLEKAKLMAASVMKDNGRFFRAGQSEVSYFRRHQTSGVVFKARLDYEMGDDLAIDLKTAKSSDPDEWNKSVLNFGYHTQQALYKWVTNRPDFVFVVVESSPPFITTAPAFLDETFIELGELLLERAIPRIGQSFAQNDWPGYVTGSGPVIIEAPPWAAKQLASLRDELE